MAFRNVNFWEFAPQGGKYLISQFPMNPALLDSLETT